MKRYKHGKTKNTADRVSFYVALSVCMVAVGLAVWSAYTTFSDYQDGSDDSYFSSLQNATTAPAAQQMTGITEAQTAPPTAAPTAAPTQAQTQAPTQVESRRKGFMIYESATLPDTEEAMNEEELSSLQAVLKVADSLVYPVKSRSVTKEYSEEITYSKTMKDYRAHAGCDFQAEKGESVYAMCDGTVKNISVSELYGVIIEVASDGFSVYYCGMDPELSVDEGDSLNAGDTVGKVSEVPCESADPAHIHIEIRVGNKLIDPLSVINSDD